MKEDAVLTIKLGMARAYLVKGRDGWLLVDSGVPGIGGNIVEKMERRGVGPNDLRLCVLTHVHYDHAGGLAKVVRACGCRVMVHAGEAGRLARGEMTIPDGRIFLTRQVARLARKHPSIAARVTRYEPVRADIEIKGETSLAPFGFDARVVPTPGHTEDSISVLTGSGRAFVGDLAYNELPFFFKDRMPPFADDPSVIRQSWKMLLRMGASVIYPGHGEAFPASELL